MKNWSFTVSSAIGFGSLLVILMAQFPATLSEFETTNGQLSKYVPDKWRAVSPEFKPPQIEIQMLRDHVSKSTGWSTKVEYTVSNNYNEIPQEKQKDNEEDDKKDVQKQTKKPSRLKHKTVIQVPIIPCPPGQKTDHLGRCREIFVID